jgi:hypothetical protein
VVVLRHVLPQLQRRGYRVVTLTRFAPDAAPVVDNEPLAHGKLAGRV